MELFEEIYRKSSLLRLQEARALNTIDEIYKALKKDDSGRRYIEKLLNGNKNLPEWIRNLADNDNLDLIREPLEKLIKIFNELNDNKKDKNGNETKLPDDFINSAICLLFKKSDSLDTMKSILANSKDTLKEYIKNANTKWIKGLKSYNDVMTQKYNPKTWHAFEKEIQNFKNNRDVDKGKEVSDEVKATLYDTLYEDDTWGLYVPKSFRGDKELASHIKAFESYGRNLNKTQWCTAAQAEYFDHYSYKGKKPLYVIKYFENGVYTEAWQIAFMDIDKHIEIMDKRDERNFDFLFKNAPRELFNKIIDTSNETKSYIFPSLVKIYNNSIEDDFDLDSGYYTSLELTNLSDDVKSLIGKEISIEEIIKARCFLTSDSLETLIKGLINLKNKGYSLEELKELRESVRHKYLRYRDLESLITLKEKGYSLEYLGAVCSSLGLRNFDSLEDCVNIIKGNFTLEELKEFRESMGTSSLEYYELESLITLKEEGYTVGYLSDVCSVVGVQSMVSLKKHLDFIKGKFSVEEVKELKKISSSIYNFLSYDDLEYLISLREKGYSLKYLSDAISILKGCNFKVLEKCLDLIKGKISLEELKEFSKSLKGRWFDYEVLEVLVRLKEKGYSLKYLGDINLVLNSHNMIDFENCLSLIKGNLTLEELKEFRESIRLSSLEYYELKYLINLKEKGYSLKYLSDVCSALGLKDKYEFRYLESCILSIKGKFSLEELKDFRESLELGSLNYYTLKSLISLKEKGYSLKYLSKVFLDSGLNNINELEKYLKG